MAVARTAQAKIFKGLVKQLQEESPEFETVLDGKGGWLQARGLNDPQLWREPLVVPIEVMNKVHPMWVRSIKIHKRPGLMDQGNLVVMFLLGTSVVARSKVPPFGSSFP